MIRSNLLVCISCCQSSYSFEELFQLNDKSRRFWVRFRAPPHF